MRKTIFNLGVFKTLLGLSIICFLQLAIAASNSANPQKTLRLPMEGADDGFDLIHSANYYTHLVGQGMFETLLTYDYLARPAQLVPGTAVALPKVSEGGKTYVFHLKKGRLFTPDAAFNGKRRELIAADYAYSIKRLLDPANRSPSASFVEGKIVGLDALVAQARKTGRFDYDAPVAGLQMPDRYTLKVRLNSPDYNFLYIIAYSGLSAVAREVVERYGHEIGQHPVGTGPYMLQQYVPRSKIVLVANPDYPSFTWNFQASADPQDAAIVQAMHGKTMPQIGRVEFNIIEEEQSRWLAFQDKQTDIDWLPALAAPLALDGTQLKPEFSKQGITLHRATEPTVSYTSFNMRDPIVGGYSDEKIALRRAISMVYNKDDEIQLIRNNQATKAEMLIPAGIAGHDPAYRSSIPYDPALANKLLDRFGYQRGIDGWRRLPNGQPLLLKIQRQPQSIDKEFAELWTRGLNQIGIRVEHPAANFADNLKAATECRLMMWGSAWLADFPEGENFVQLLYGPNAGQGNHACYQSKAFDALYEQAIALPPGPLRNQLYLEMSRQLEADTVWVVNSSKIRNWLTRPWVKGFKKHPFMAATWQYLDLEPR